MQVFEDVFYITNRHIDVNGLLNTDYQFFKIEALFNKDEVDNDIDNINIIIEKEHFSQVLGINFKKPLIGDFITFNSNKKYRIKKREKLNENDVKLHNLFLEKI